MAYCTESDVYDATGQKTTIVQKMSGKSEAQVTTFINSCIAKADQMVKNELGVPVAIRKEFHQFQYEDYIPLGPDQDKFGFYNAYNPAGCVTHVFAIYGDNCRVKLPYPKDCDSLTESHANYTGTGCILSTDTAVFKCGTASVKSIFSTAGSFYFPTAQNMDKNIESWDFIGFWFKTTDKTAIFTIKLFDEAGKYISSTFTLKHSNNWEIVKLRYADFTNTDGITFDINNLLEYIQIESSKACTVNFDNFNFNDGIFWTYPEGLICWSVPTSAGVSSYEALYVTYSFDPYALVVPEDIKLASAKKAGILLLEFMIGCRQRITAFTQTSDALDNLPDRETLEFRRAELQRQVEGILAGIGFKTYEGMDEGF